MIALIPARAGSKRIPGKNTKPFFGAPLLAYTVNAALESGVFSDVACSTDDRDTALIASDYGARPLMREAAYATDTSPDIDWVRYTFRSYRVEEAQAFCILRPTSPFRTAQTIRRAYAQFQTMEAHSLRAVQPVKEHPLKMWHLGGAGYPMTPFIGMSEQDGTPCHSMPTQSLPPVYIQNASLEMAWTYVVNSYGTISGKKVAPFFTEGYEGFDLNTMDDWREAERLITEGHVALPMLARV